MMRRRHHLQRSRFIPRRIEEGKGCGTGIMRMCCPVNRSKRTYGARGPRRKIAKAERMKRKDEGVGLGPRMRVSNLTGTHGHRISVSISPLNSTILRKMPQNTCSSLLKPSHQPARPHCRHDVLSCQKRS